MTGETRTLPALAPGSTDTTFVIKGYDEVVPHDIVRGDHSHPFHELLWNERGATSAVVGARVWTVLRWGCGCPRAHCIPTRPRRAPGSVRVSSASAPRRRYPTRPRPSGSRHCCGCCWNGWVNPVFPPPSARRPRCWCSTCSGRRRANCSSRCPPSALLCPIAEAVRADPGNLRTLTDWASALGVSTRTITRAFHTEPGAGFARRVAAVRAQHAVTLLSRGWDIESVAEQVGWLPVGERVRRGLPADDRSDSKHVPAELSGPRGTLRQNRAIPRLPHMPIVNPAPGRSSCGLRHFRTSGTGMNRPPPISPGKMGEQTAIYRSF